MVNQCTKFEISKFTRYEAMNRLPIHSFVTGERFLQNAENGVVWGS